jgi:hypothetical protein
MGATTSTTEVNFATQCQTNCTDWATWPLPPQAPTNYSINGGSATGTVTDNVTGLVWQREATYYVWASAQTYCAGLNLGGASVGTWRLPTSIELLSLVDDTQYGPAINRTAFPNTQSSSFWSWSPYVYYSGYAWDVAFYDGRGYYDTSNGSYVRCVY